MLGGACRKIAAGRGLGAGIVALTVAFGMPAAAAGGDARLDYAPEIRAMREIRDGLAVIAIGDQIRKTCPSIGAQWVNVWRFGRHLKGLAREAGFTDEQIERYVGNDAEKAYYKGLARDWLDRRGVTEDEPESYCRVGHAEIERRSRLGVLLWSQKS